MKRQFLTDLAHTLENVIAFYDQANYRCFLTYYGMAQTYIAILMEQYDVYIDIEGGYIKELNDRCFELYHTVECGMCEEV